VSSLADWDEYEHERACRDPIGHPKLVSGRERHDDATQSIDRGSCPAADARWGERTAVLATHIEHGHVGRNELGDSAGGSAPSERHCDHVNVTAGDQGASDRL
jgi:hypothetical protein